MRKNSGNGNANITELTLEKRIQAAQRVLSSLEERLEKQRNALAAMTSEYTEACKRLAAGESVGDVEEIRARMQTASDVCVQLQTEYEKHRNLLDQMCVELNAAKVREEAIQRQLKLKELEQDREAAGKECEELVRQLDAARSRFFAAEARWMNLRDDIRSEQLAAAQNEVRLRWAAQAAQRRNA